MTTVTDLFCGAGGSGLGATAVPGVQLKLAANHWKLAVDTHAANFPDTDHDVADISQVNPRRYNTTDILWASPECTNHSQAKGVARQLQQPDLFGQTVADEAAERSRATMWDVPRFAEFHKYKFVVVENVVEAAKWVMFPAWLQAMQLLGYKHREVYLNSMHAPGIQAPRAPQSRDRIYIVFWHQGMNTPQLDPRPLAHCNSCDEDVQAIQSWKNPNNRWGRYRSQYVYRCPKSECRFAIVEPYADPAAAAIDWSIPGQRIGDRARPLKPATMARIKAGLERYARPITLEVGGNTYERPNSGYVRAWPTDEPMKTMCATTSRGLAVPPLVVPVEGRDGKQARPVAEPMRTMTARAETGVAVPPGEIAFIAELRGGGSKDKVRPVTDPLATVTASGNHHMLVRNNGSRGDGGEMCTPVSEPARTMTTTGHQSLVGWDEAPPAVEDCTFRMLEPGEVGRAMAFRSDYQVLGNRREQVRQYGNAVTPPAAEWIIRTLLESTGELEALSPRGPSVADGFGIGL